MSLVQCSNVIKNFQMGKVQVEILKGVSLNIEKGEFAAIIGESGSGKSTLLNILGGLMPFDKGEVSIADTNLHNLNENQRALFRRKSIGFIFQSYNLLPQLTAFENVEMPLIFTGMSKVNRKKTVLDILEHVGLKDRMNHKPSELSGGQQQRVSIARALVNNPSIILADEPTGNLDSKTSVEILDLLKGLNESLNMTFVVVTHSKRVCDYADSIIKMKDGLLE
ncbi:ABC transporter ATP-binding protein [Clostridium algidicarnis]|uniref:ABC transporter ATP-binding protein n=1 Tax=Clostridium algidicarnis TaxID=37659 RepID=A0ABS6C1T3_9CLOT|nr:ABC transporter ATP-binding protein [Clostridium algidicarnis]MBB6697163.1 ABC transporter ATP-binding protein [Clostridium algidicarnis]MBU3192417.1 ABC transporter ATP-binding protein [Clostridium algidicarnis]MBU3204435.1 ABC transporter ATP-binding protein [Clostridium algidicarnis]MBU3206437.1 ABC transporter ATP-binding protein [Clostridium algidicarnis]MBU3212482.1 ABC transporter ATP-binding protein [Clostridium algidicarnis]